jgi:hypothetical protein
MPRDIVVTDYKYSTASHSTSNLIYLEKIQLVEARPSVVRESNTTLLFVLSELLHLPFDEGLNLFLCL